MRPVPSLVVALVTVTLLGGNVRGAGAPATHPARPDRERWDLRLYLEDAVVPPGGPSSVVVALRNRSGSPARVWCLPGRVHEPPAPRPATRQSGAGGDGGEGEAPASVLSKGGGELDGKPLPADMLDVVILLRGRHDVPGMFPVPPIRNVLLEPIPLGPGRTQFFVESLTWGTLQAGDYELQAFLLRQHRVLARSKLGHIHVTDADPQPPPWAPQPAATRPAAPER